MDNFKELLNDLETEYPRHHTSNYVSSNYGRPMRITLKDGTIFGVLWFRWEQQRKEDLDHRILCFNSGNRDIDKLRLAFDSISKVEWD